ncbi:type II toxin-antitoxin system CcdA family antitoxin [Candidatus Symbiopectobacterium sp. NZEC151]|uniref:type II toxin-antitoxin system CcdA family antitoxin n=1 Tax=unclassified Symbiopectobacterium TaxID=2794573 RepID=UPI0034DB540E
MKRCVSVAWDKDNYQVLSASGVNISRLENDVIGKETRRIKVEQCLLIKLIVKYLQYSQC